MTSRAHMEIPFTEHTYEWIPNLRDNSLEPKKQKKDKKTVRAQIDITKSNQMQGGHYQTLLEARH